MKNFPKKLPIILPLLFLIGIILCFSDFIIPSFHEIFKNENQAEEELACFLEYSEGVGKAAVKICYDDDGNVLGVAVVCTGAENAAVRAEVIQLVSKSVGISTHRIYVSASSDAFEKLFKEKDH